MTELDQDNVKQALKEGLKEWMDDKFATFGKYSLAAIGAAVLSVLMYVLLLLNGWHK